MNKIKHPELKRQIVDFSGLEFGSCSPTDIDAFVEIHNEVFIFYEGKYKDTPLPFGQRLAYTRLVDALTAAGKQAILLVFRHAQANPEMNIYASECIIDSCYFAGRWWTGDGRTAKQVTEDFIRERMKHNEQNPV